MARDPRFDRRNSPAYQRGLAAGNAAAPTSLRLPDNLNGKARVNQDLYRQGLELGLAARSGALPASQWAKFLRDGPDGFGRSDYDLTVEADEDKEETAQDKLYKNYDRLLGTLVSISETEGVDERERDELFGKVGYTKEQVDEAVQRLKDGKLPQELVLPTETANTQRIDEMAEAFRRPDGGFDPDVARNLFQLSKQDDAELRQGRDDAARRFQQQTEQLREGFQGIAPQPPSPWWLRALMVLDVPDRLVRAGLGQVGATAERWLPNWLPSPYQLTRVLRAEDGVGWDSFWEDFNSGAWSSEKLDERTELPKWASFLFGFGLDIALAPTTYITGGSGAVAKVAGRGGTKATQMLVTKADDLTGLIAKTPDGPARAKLVAELDEVKRVAERSGRSGFAGLNQSERAVLERVAREQGVVTGKQSLQGGWYMRLPGMEGLYLPGTRTVLNPVSRGVARGFGSMKANRNYKRGADLFKTQKRVAYQNLRSMEFGKVKQALESITAINTAKAKSAGWFLAGETEGKLVQRTLQRLGVAKSPEFRALIEYPDADLGRQWLARQPADKQPELRQAADDVAEWFERRRIQFNENVGFEAIPTGQGRTNYVFHLLDEDYAKVINASQAGGTGFEPAAFQRKANIVAGGEYLGVRLLEPSEFAAAYPTLGALTPEQQARLVALQKFPDDIVAQAMFSSDLETVMNTYLFMGRVRMEASAALRYLQEVGSATDVAGWKMLNSNKVFSKQELFWRKYGFGAKAQELAEKATARRAGQQVPMSAAEEAYSGALLFKQVASGEAPVAALREAVKAGRDRAGLFVKEFEDKYGRLIDSFSRLEKAEADMSAKIADIYRKAGQGSVSDAERRMVAEWAVWSQDRKAYPSNIRPIIDDIERSVNDMAVMFGDGIASDFALLDRSRVLLSQEMQVVAKSKDQLRRRLQEVSGFGSDEALSTRIAVQEQLAFLDELEDLVVPLWNNVERVHGSFSTMTDWLKIRPEPSTARTMLDDALYDVSRPFNERMSAVQDAVDRMGLGVDDPVRRRVGRVLLGDRQGRLVGPDGKAVRMVPSEYGGYGRLLDASGRDFMQGTPRGAASFVGPTVSVGSDELVSSMFSWTVQSRNPLMFQAGNADQLLRAHMLLVGVRDKIIRFGVVEDGLTATDRVLLGNLDVLTRKFLAQGADRNPLLLTQFVDELDSMLDVLPRVGGSRVEAVLNGSSNPTVGRAWTAAERDELLRMVDEVDGRFEQLYQSTFNELTDELRDLNRRVSEIRRANTAGPAQPVEAAVASGVVPRELLEARNSLLEALDTYAGASYIAKSGRAVPKAEKSVRTSVTSPQEKFERALSDYRAAHHQWTVDVVRGNDELLSLAETSLRDSRQDQIARLLRNQEVAERIIDAAASGRPMSKKQIEAAWETTDWSRPYGSGKRGETVASDWLEAARDNADGARRRLERLRSEPPATLDENALSTFVSDIPLYLRLRDGAAKDASSVSPLMREALDALTSDTVDLMRRVAAAGEALDSQRVLLSGVAPPGSVPVSRQLVNQSYLDELTAEMRELYANAGTSDARKALESSRAAAQALLESSELPARHTSGFANRMKRFDARYRLMTAETWDADLLRLAERKSTFENVFLEDRPVLAWGMRDRDASNPYVASTDWWTDSHRLVSDEAWAPDVKFRVPSVHGDDPLRWKSWFSDARIELFRKILGEKGFNAVRGRPDDIAAASRKMMKAVDETTSATSKSKWGVEYDSLVKSVDAFVTRTRGVDGKSPNFASLIPDLQADGYIRARPFQYQVDGAGNGHVLFRAVDSADELEKPVALRADYYRDFDPNLEVWVHPSSDLKPVAFVKDGNVVGVIMSVRGIGVRSTDRLLEDAAYLFRSQIESVSKGSSEFAKAHSQDLYRLLNSQPAARGAVDTSAIGKLNKRLADEGLVWVPEDQIVAQRAWRLEDTPLDSLPPQSPVVASEAPRSGSKAVGEVVGGMEAEAWRNVVEAQRRLDRLRRYKNGRVTDATPDDAVLGPLVQLRQSADRMRNLNVFDNVARRRVADQLLDDILETNVGRLGRTMSNEVSQIDGGGRFLYNFQHTQEQVAATYRSYLKSQGYDSILTDNGVRRQVTTLSPQQMVGDNKASELLVGLQNSYGSLRGRVAQLEQQMDDLASQFGLNPLRQRPSRSAARASAKENRDRLRELVENGVQSDERMIRQEADTLFKRANKLEREAADIAETQLQVDGLRLIAQREVATADQLGPDGIQGLNRFLSDNVYTGNLSKVNGLAEQIAQVARQELKYVGGGMWAGNDFVDAIDAVRKLTNPKEVGGLLKMLDGVTNFFKAWALATVGFLTRNFYGAMFNNWLAGMNLGSFTRFAKAHRMYLGELKGGASKEQALQAVANKMGERTSNAYGMWLEAAPYASGGQAASIATDVGSGVGPGTFRQTHTYVRRREMLHPSDNPLTRTVFYGTTTSEFYVRGSLFFDGVYRHGDTVSQGMERVFKYHFDYQELSWFEQNFAKRAMPFYIWSSHNLPLQVEGIVSRPKVGLSFYKAKSNMEELSEDGSFVPDYFLRMGGMRTPFKSGDNHVWFAPDLPIKDLNLVPGLGTFNELTSLLNPIFASPVETFVARRNFFTDAPIEDRLINIPSTWERMGLGRALDIMGQTERDQDGNRLLNQRLFHLIDSNLPIFSRTRRLDPTSTDPKVQERLATAWLSTFVGVGWRTNTFQDQSNEVRRRQEMLDHEIRRMRAKGMEVPSVSDIRKTGALGPAAGESRSVEVDLGGYPFELEYLLDAANSMDAKQLQRVPGFGEDTAIRTVMAREQYGRLNSVEDMLELPGMNRKKLENAVLRLRENPEAMGLPSLEPINLATADALTLEELPGIGEVLARRIVEGRNSIGGLNSVDDLAQLNIPPRTVEGIRKFLAEDAAARQDWRFRKYMEALQIGR